MYKQAVGLHDFEALAREFNSVKEFSEQHHSIDASVLEVAGQIFLKHAAHQKFALVLLHRHQQLCPGFGMVRLQTTQSEDVCMMQPLATSVLHPHTLFLSSKDEFIPLEFSADPTTTPEQEFLADFGAFLEASQLRQLLGLSVIPRLDGKWLERELPGTTGTIATRCNTETALLGDCEDEGVTAAWKFLSDRTGMRVTILRKCKTDNSGGHVASEVFQRARLWLRSPLRG